MNNKLLNLLTACTLVTSLALAPPALARGGGGGGGGHFGGMGGGHFGGGHFGGARFAHGGFGPRFAHAGFSRGFAFRHGFHHRFHRFAFVGAPFAYAAYDSCWRRTWTPYGLQWVDVCGYGYGY